VTSAIGRTQRAVHQTLSSQQRKKNRKGQNAQEHHRIRLCRSNYC
jgi:hypothetical protein